MTNHDPPAPTSNDNKRKGVSVIGVALTARSMSSKRSSRSTVTWMMLLLLLILVAGLNVMILENHPPIGATKGGDGVLPLPFQAAATTNKYSSVSRGRGLLEDKSLELSSPIDEQGRIRTPKALLGLFTQDDEMGVHQRQYYRNQFTERHKGDPRVCSWADYDTKPALRSKCLLVYTFVLGGNLQPTAQLEIVDHSMPLLIDKVLKPNSPDVNLPDVTRLNIRDNLHEGKAQTCLYFVHSHVLTRHADIDYYVKVSGDTALNVTAYLDGFVARGDLPPPPFHRNVLGGSIRDKAYWIRNTLDDGNNNDNTATSDNKIKNGSGGTTTATTSQHANVIPQGGRILRTPPPASAKKNTASTKDTRDAEKDMDATTKNMPRLESFWGNEFDGVHLYFSGELYVISRDLVAFLLQEIPYSKSRIAPGGYLEGDDGHDISSMAFHSPTPLQLVTIGRSQQFWDHPIKTFQHWDDLRTKLLVKH